MQAADVADDRPANRRDVFRRRHRPPRGRARIRSRLTPNGNRCTRWLKSRGALAQLLRGDEDQVGVAEQLLFARRNPPRLRRARGEIVDAVVDGQPAVEAHHQIARERRRQERPGDRPVESGGAIQRRSAPQQQRPVDPLREPRVRQRHDQRRVDEQVGRSWRNPLVPRHQLRQPLAHARQVAHARRPDAGVLDEQHAMPLGRQRRHDFLVALPDEVPVDRRDAEDVRAALHHRDGAAVAGFFSSRR